MQADEIKSLLSSKDTHLEINFNESEYHALANHHIISSSQLKFLDQTSPRHFKDKYISQIIEPDKSDDLDFGSLIHQAFLEGHHDQFVMSPKFDLRKTADKIAKQEFIDNNPGKTLIDKKKWDDARYILDELSQYREKYNLDSAMKEASFFWRDDLNLRVRCDAYHPDTNTLFELKTAKTANPKYFSSDFFNRGYDISAAMYCDGIERVLNKPVEQIIMIVVEKTRPFVSVEFQITEEIIDIGMRKYIRLKDDLHWCYENDAWPGYSGQIYIPKYEQIETVGSEAE